MSSILSVPTASSGVLVGPGDVPLPPPSVVKRLAAISPRLSIEWITGAWRPYWGLKIRWPEGDQRWEWVRTGRIPESSAFDLEQMFPDDCTTEDMAAYVEQRWGNRAANPVADAERMVEATRKQNTDALTANVRELVTKGEERYERETPHQRNVLAGVETAHPMVSGGLSK